MAETRDSSIVLHGGNPERLAPLLARLFGIEASLAAQIVRAAPIVLVEGLAAGQAAAVCTALSELTAAGAQIAVKTGPVGSIPKVGWGGIPKIAGKPATEYTAAADRGFTCPCCGASFTLVVSSAPQAEAPAAVQGKSAAAHTPSTKDSGFEEIPLPEALKSLESPPDLPDVPEVPSAGAAVPKPVAAPQPKGGAISASKVKPNASAPMALEDFEAGLASDDSMLSDLDEGLPNVPDEPPKPVPVKPAPRPPTQRTVPPKPPGPAKQVLKVTGLDDLQIEGAGAAPAKNPAPPAKPAPAKPSPAKPSPAKPAPAKSTPAPAGDDKFNIFASRSNNPRMVELIAKIRGVSQEEAEELAQKPLVTIAKNISRKQAEVIRDKFAESRISVRMSPANPSQRTQAPSLEED
jgi:ribosomal protein L7/L12